MTSDKICSDQERGRSCQMPPKEDCHLHLHALRIWKTCLEQHPGIPKSDAGHEWLIEDSLLSIMWIIGFSIPLTVLEFMPWQFRKALVPKCECLSNGLSYKLQSCTKHLETFLRTSKVFVQCWA